MRRCLVLLVLCLIALSVSACNPFVPVRRPPQQAIGDWRSLRYPADAPLGTDLDIVVVRDRTAIEMINHTPRSYHNHQIWINQEYVTRAELIRIGTGNRFELASFINKHDQLFPIGAFLAPDRTRRIVLAELFDTAARKRHRLVVRRDED